MEGIWQESLLTLWLIGTKYIKKIALCDTNTAKMLTIVIIIDTQFLPMFKKKLGGITNPKKSMSKVGKILKLWDEKVTIGIAVF